MPEREKPSRKPVRSSKSARGLARLLDESGVPVWLIGSDGQLAHFSRAATDWLGLQAEALLGRRSVAGSPISDDPLDYLAASLSPPPGLASRGTASLRIEPPPIDGRAIASIDVRFLRIGDASSFSVLAVAGSFDDARVDDELGDAVALRQHLDAWRKRHASMATIATAGTSSAVKRLHQRLRVAASTRSHVGFFGPPGCGAESIASRVHQLSAPREPLVTVEGPLMDAELLDASLMPLIHRLSDSDEATATALIRGLDEMPPDAQIRLNELVDIYDSRFRLLGICGRKPGVLSEPLDDTDSEENLLELDEEVPGGLLPVLVDRLSALSVSIAPLASRVEDIPLLATAALDARRAAGETTAERISRGALDALVIYPWPRNFDELIDAMAHAVRHAHQSSIAAEHLPLAIRSFRPGETAASIHSTTRLPLDESMRRFELQIIEEVLDATEGNRAEAARRLGISRARLIRRLDHGDAPDESREDP